MDALIRVRCLHNVCSHSSLGSLCFSQIRITDHHCPHLTIISKDKAAEGTHQWSHSVCADSDTTLLFFQAHTWSKTKAHSAHVCHLSDKIIAFLALWCYLRGRTLPHTPLPLLLFPTTWLHDLGKSTCLTSIWPFISDSCLWVMFTYKHTTITDKLIAPGLVWTCAKLDQQESNHDFLLKINPLLKFTWLIRFQMQGFEIWLACI